MTSSQTEPYRLPVLVVDDDPQMLRTITDILRMNGYAPTGATTGVGGLELAASMEHSPAIALVDLSLPDMDGIEVVARLHTLSALTQVVILTGNASVDSAVRALREQSYDYLIKPVQPDHLLATLERAGERSYRRRAEEGMRESEERMRQIFAHVSDALFIVDDCGVIVDANPAATVLTGQSLSQLRSVRLNEVLPEIDTVADDGSDGKARTSAVLSINTSPRVLDIQSARFAPGVRVYTIRDLTKQRQLETEIHQPFIDRLVVEIRYLRPQFDYHLLRINSATVSDFFIRGSHPNSYIRLNWQFRKISTRSRGRIGFISQLGWWS